MYPTLFVWGNLRKQINEMLFAILCFHREKLTIMFRAFICSKDKKKVETRMPWLGEGRGEGYGDGGGMLMR